MGIAAKSVFQSCRRTLNVSQHCRPADAVIPMTAGSFSAKRKSLFFIIHRLQVPQESSVSLLYLGRRGRTSVRCFGDIHAAIAPSPYKGADNAAQICYKVVTLLLGTLRCEAVIFLYVPGVPALLPAFLSNACIHGIRAACGYSPSNRRLPTKTISAVLGLASGGFPLPFSSSFPEES